MRPTPSPLQTQNPSVRLQPRSPRTKSLSTTQTGRPSPPREQSQRLLRPSSSQSPLSTESEQVCEPASTSVLPCLHMGSSSSWLHQAPLSLWLRLGQSLLCLQHGIPCLELRFILLHLGSSSALASRTNKAIQSCWLFGSAWVSSVSVCRTPGSICQISTVAPSFLDSAVLLVDIWIFPPSVPPSIVSMVVSSVSST